MEKPRPSNDPPDQRVISISPKLAERLERLHQHPICRALPDIERVAEMVMVLGAMELERSIDAPVPSFHVIAQTWLMSVTVPDRDPAGQALGILHLMRQVGATVLCAHPQDVNRKEALCSEIAHFCTRLALIAGASV